MQKILVVGDILVSHQTLKEAFENEYELIEATNGYEAISLMYREYKSLAAVLLDAQMPVMDGFEVLKSRRSNPILAQIPVIVVLSGKDEAMKEKALELGAVSVLTRPYEPGELVERLRQFVKKQKNMAADIGKLDTLTQVYRRIAFFEKAAAMILEQEAGYYAIACVNIDSFKVINDQFGTGIGDKVLQHVSFVLKQCVEKVGGICGRINADDFAMLLPASFICSDELEGVYQQSVSPKCLSQKIRIRVGCYFINESSLSVTTMYDRAKIAADSIRGNYDTCVIEYDDTMRDDLVRDQKLASEMEHALHDGQFVPWLQPQYDHSTGAVIGAEALARWNKNGTYIPPAQFIPFFEQNGFIYEMDKSIWEQVCILLRKWLDEGVSPLSISINISRKDIFHGDFINTITDLIDKYSIPAKLLRLEVTESSFSESTKVIVSKVNELIKLGFTVEIDDFGSGYSSLNTLKDVPASTLKLDMRFFENAENNQRSGNIVESIVRMAKKIGMAVIAEGVEDKAQADYLKSIGCNYIQGYYYARPMPVDEFEKHIRASLEGGQPPALKNDAPFENANFWDPNSLDTLIYNSFAGAACILEYTRGKIEMIRANDFYEEMLGSTEMGIRELLSFDWMAHMEEKDTRVFADAVAESAKTKKTVSGCFELHDIPGCPRNIYLRANLRVISAIGDCYLIYCLNENITGQKDTQLKERSALLQLQAIMAKLPCPITAVRLRGEGDLETVFANDRFYELCGYTREELAAQAPNALDLVAQEDRAAGLQACRRILNKGGSENVRLRFLRRNGSSSPAECSLSILSTEDSDRLLLCVISVPAGKNDPK